MAGCIVVAVAGNDILCPARLAAMANSLPSSLILINNLLRQEGYGLKGKGVVRGAETNRYSNSNPSIGKR